MTTRRSGDELGIADAGQTAITQALDSSFGGTKAEGSPRHKGEDVQQPGLCRLCGSGKLRPVGPATLNYGECIGCNAMVAGGASMLHDTAEYYSHYYPPVPDQRIIRLWGTRRHRLFDGILGGLDSLRVEKGRLLDVGCGYGFFLQRARARGWEPHGVDLSPSAVEYARSGLGLHVVAGDAVCAGYPENYFKVITLLNIIEHVADPVALLCWCNAALDRGGLIVIRTPNFAFAKLLLRLLDAGIVRGRVDMVDPKQHLNIFGNRGLRSLLKRAGFDVLTIGHGEPMSGGSGSLGMDMARSFSTHLAEMVLRASGGRLHVGPSILVYARKV